MRYFALFIFSVIAGCTSQSLEDIKVDCAKNPLVLTVQVTDSDCGQNNGSLSATVIGGESPFLYNLGGGEQPGPDFINLSPGTYTLTVTDANNCSVDAPVVIANKSGTSATATSTIAGCGTNLGTITVSAADGVEPYQYSLNGGSFQSSNVFDGVSAGLQRIIIADANGCEFILDHLVLAGTSYASEVGPIIMNNCAVTGCHSGSQFPNFSIFANVQANAENIKARTQSGSMPPGGRTLTNDQIALIACWVDDGAKDN